MRRLCVYTIFDPKTNRPTTTGISLDDKIIVREMYRPGAGKLLADIYKIRDIVAAAISSAAKDGIEIVTSDFKSHITAFNLPLHVDYPVYDMHIPLIGPSGSKQQDAANVRKVLQRFKTQKTKEYQRILANADVVYKDLQDTGLIVGYCDRRPIYGHTVTGRSKTSGFNIQGLSTNDQVWNKTTSPNNILLHFDWICADIRIAALLSGDEKLLASFDHSDPYTVLMDEVNANSGEKLTRDEAKTFLLKSINSMDYTSDALTKTYPGLGDWIRRCDARLMAQDGYLETILRRRFRLSNCKNKLAVLNAVMQGSVAHAMQLVIRKVWELFGTGLITEIHDCLVVSCARDPKIIDNVISQIAKIMLHPFEGVLPSNPSFPLKVNIGTRWAKWKQLRVYR